MHDFGGSCADSGCSGFRKLRFNRGGVEIQSGYGGVAVVLVLAVELVHSLEGGRRHLASKPAAYEFCGECRFLTIPFDICFVRTVDGIVY
jgi:hypothetical protein